MDNRANALKMIETMIAFQKLITVPYDHKSDSKSDDFPDFKIQSVLASSNRHPNFIAEETSSKTKWFLKKADNKLTAARELIFQELLRLIVGETQPKTKIIVNAKGEIYIASQAIPDSTPMMNGSYVLIASEILEADLVIFGQLYFLAETFEHDDASLRNALIDKSLIPRFVDGEHALSSLLDENPLKTPVLTARDVKFFPFPSDFKPEFGWLDQVVSSPDGIIRAKNPTTLCQKLYHSKEFQYGAYLAGIKIVNVLPWIRHFIAGLLKANNLRIDNEEILFKRIEMLINSLKVTLPYNVVFNDESYNQRGLADYKIFTQRISTDKEFLALITPKVAEKEVKEAVVTTGNLNRLSLLRHKTTMQKGITIHHHPVKSTLKRSVTR